MPIPVQSFAGQNWLITPAALGPGQTAPRPAAQTWLVVLSGVVIINLQGANANDWLRGTVTINPDSLRTAVEFAINTFHLPTPNGDPGLDLQQWAPFASLSSVFEKNSGGVDAGYAVDAWRPSPFESGTDLDGTPASRLFAGIDVDVAVRNTKATLFRLGYNFTLLGKIAAFPVIQ